MTTEPIVVPIPGPREAGRAGRRGLLGFAAAVVVAPALTTFAAVLAMLLSPSLLGGPDGGTGLLWMLLLAPLLGVVAGALGAAAFLGPWLAAAGVFREVAPGRAAYALAGGAAGISYALAGVAADLAGSGGFAVQSGFLSAVFGVWPAAMNAQLLLGGGNFEPGSMGFLAAPPFAGLAAGWVYALIAGKG